MAREDWSSRIAPIMRETGLRGKDKALDIVCSQMEHLIQVNGLLINLMDKEP